MVLLVTLVVIWTEGGPGIAAYIAILSAGIAVSMGDAMGNLAGWLYILSRHPFRLGDRIEINGQRGDIVDIGVFQFSMVEIGNWVEADQTTGRLLHIPNAWVFRHSVSNYTMGFEFIWDEIPVTVTFESNWHKAKELLTELLEELDDFDNERAADELDEAADRFAVEHTYMAPSVWTTVADMGVTLTMRYASRPRRRRANESRVWEAVLDLFAAHDDIDFAYPTTRFYDNRSEGVPARPVQD